ncbi:YheC/YheD family protein [Ammoniphilus sp. CFH 90114]|uniref:YheC/YheD family endospore coat-associated protein n=1 Tax=Ammoniphilus sp. CFH 90114 TaxID=2493665 RepID=UPI00196B3FD2|nr:YheC/YheD family protein [Ammoniphilus sp. CFH 90114]
MKINWRENLTSDILIPRQVRRKYPAFPDSLTVKIGQWVKEVRVKCKDEVEDDAIDISSSTFNGLTIPQGLHYEIRMDRNTLVFGPVIAIVVRKKRLTRSLLNELKVYFSEYEKIKGLLYVCTEANINKSNKTIKGYSYNPYRNNGSCWERGVFPFPQVVFQRYHMKRSTRKALTEAKCIVFNEYFFNKWEFWKWMEPHPQVKKYVPYTQKLDSIKDLDFMLDRFGKVMLKPNLGSLGIGIIQAEKLSQDQYLFTCPLMKDSLHIIHRFTSCPREQEWLIENIKKENYIVYRKQVNNMEELHRFINTLIKHDYLIQQAVMAKKYNNRCVDFRVILQKGKEKSWEKTAIIARVGKVDSVISNFTMAGFALSAKEAYKTIFQLNETQVKEKEREIIQVCRNVCNIIEQYGVYGDVGIDVMLDCDLNVWIIEINKRHFHDYPLFALKDEALYRKVCTTPIEYAKALTGF